MKGTMGQSVAALIRELGYFPASVQGWSVTDSFCSDRKEVGILWNNPDSPMRSYFWGWIQIPALYQFVGVIWLENERLGTENNHLVIGVFGQKNMAIAQSIADKLSVRLNVSIAVVLESEEYREETINYTILKGSVFGSNI